MGGRPIIGCVGPLVTRKTSGKWLIVHEQVSVPIDSGSGKAVLDLKP